MGSIPATDGTPSSLPWGSPLSSAEILDPWAWHVVEEEAWEPELLGSILTHLVLSLNPVHSRPSSSSPSTSKQFAGKKARRVDPMPRVVEGP